MTFHSETIAAILASQTPIGTQYRLVAVPGTELTDAECPLCAGPHTLTQCAEWAGGPRLIEGLRAEIAELREELATAHEIVGALMVDTDDEAYYDFALSAARAWLRRRG